MNVDNGADKQVSQGSWKSWKELLLEKAGFKYELRAAYSIIFTNPGKASEISLP